MFNISAKRKAPESPLTPSKKCQVLTVAEKVDVIKTVQNGCSHRQVALDLDRGRTQINNIIKNKNAIMEAFESGVNCKNKYLAPRYLPNADIDERTWAYFCEMLSKCTPVSGPMLQ